MLQQKRKDSNPGKVLAANITETELEGQKEGSSKIDGQEPSLTKVIKQELMKLMKGKASLDPIMTNFAHLEDYKGSVLTRALTCLDLIDPDSWVVDSGASNHMCAN